MSDSVLTPRFFLQAPLFAALGDETRLSLLARLCRVTHQSISQLAEGTKLTRQAVTKHLQVLEDVGLVKSVRKGRETLFEFDDTPIETMTEYLELVTGQWEKKLGDLKDFLGE
jgi:DNA-binding transcriptional ArsR family regulator